MKILVCFKITPELEHVIESDWQQTTQYWYPDYVKRVYSCFDEAALEQALRLKDVLVKEGQDCHCTALTIGDTVVQDEALLKNLYAVGFDRVAVICRQAEFSQRWVVKQISEFIKENGFDLVLMGKQAGFCDSGRVPLLTGEMLGWPVLTEVYEIGWEKNALNICQATDWGGQRLSLCLPLVLTIGTPKASVLRMPTLRQRLEAGKRQIDEFTACDEPQGESLIELFCQQKEKSCRFFEGDEQDVAQRLSDVIFNGRCDA